MYLYTIHVSISKGNAQAVQSTTAIAARAKM
jgi:hypothetical protein